MALETTVTLQGNLGGDVVLRHAGGHAVAAFTIACTPRIRQRETQEWIDGETQWFAVRAWRRLGEHCADSLRRGDPVVVHGRLHTRRYVNKTGQEVTAFEVEATTVGHDLNRGLSRFERPGRPAGAAPTSVEPAAVVPAVPVTEAQAGADVAA